MKIMIIRFNIEYHTTFGEALTLNMLTKSTYRLGTADGYHWSVEVTLKDITAPYIDYYYTVERCGKTVREEWRVEPHRLEFGLGKTDCYTIYDHWIDIPDDAYMYSSAITECINANRRGDADIIPNSDKVLRLKLRAPQLKSNEQLAILGREQALGEWTALKAIRMKEHCAHEWVVNLDATAFNEGQEIEYKFVILDTDNDVTPEWEKGQNRTLTIPKIKDGETIVYELRKAEFDRAPWKCAGTVIPIFSLRSEGSYGVGDFGDLRAMVDWADHTSQRVIQVLPINDTISTKTWMDSYPYNSISIYALHPQYADLRQLPPLKDEQRAAYYESIRQEINGQPQIDYERMIDAKLGYLREIYAQEAATVMKSAEFKVFFTANKEWLVPYAAFCHYRDLYGTAAFNEWPDHHTLSDDEREKMGKTTTKLYREVAFWYFVQYVLDTQMKAVHAYARSKRVILKGDIPIGISRDGVEAWVEPRYFNMNGQAGAPPDAFSTNGQNWGFPTYNWEEMLADGCSWWVRRFTKMSQYFDAYRIDHVLGFFRIWEIPIDAVHGLLGQFSPSLAMTPEEIEGYGLHFNEHHFTTPFIANWTIDRMFGAKAGEIKEKYLDNIHDDIWAMKPEYDTQRKVEAAFKDVTDIEQLNIRDGLYAMISDVLFIRDRKEEGKYHPRIGVQNDFIYEALYDIDKAAFNRLYNDYFYRRNDHYWYSEAMKKLPLLTGATRMLVCAEDLGMVPGCVPWVMNELRILSLEIQSMPKDDTVRFGHLSRNPYRSVCTISTHDMPTLRQWWDEDEERTQAYFNTMLYHGGRAPHPLPGWLAQDIVSRHLTSPSMLCLLSLQDWMAIDEQLRLPNKDAERINVPSNPRHYWRYRMHLNIEQLMMAEGFNHEIKEMIKNSGRRCR